jgi:hypothetical protein
MESECLSVDQCKSKRALFGLNPKPHRFYRACADKNARATQSEADFAIVAGGERNGCYNSRAAPG